MKYKQENILELSQYVKRLSIGQRRSLYDHCCTLKNSKRFIQDLETLDFTNPIEKDSYQILKSDLNRSFYRFKKKLEEFRLTEQSINFLKEKDIHAHQQLVLSKRVLSAQIEFDEGLSLNAIDSWKSCYKVALKNECLNQQKAIAEKLKRAFQLIGSYNDYKYWKTEIFKINSKIERFNRLSNKFNEYTAQLWCCQTHKININRESLIPFQLTYNKTSLLKVKWMRSFLRVIVLRQEGEYKTAQRLAWQLLDIFLKNQNKLSTQYYLLLMQLILENMYFLNKTYVVSRASKHISSLHGFPIYQRFPLLSLFFFEKFRQGQDKDMDREINLILDDANINSFQHILQHVHFFRIHMLFLKLEYKSILFEINSNSSLIALQCPGLKAEIKILEIICLIELRKNMLAFDRLESFRKFLSRNNDYTFYKSINIIYQLLKYEIKGNVKKKSELMVNLYELDNTLYSFAPFTVLKWLDVKT